MSMAPPHMPSMPAIVILMPSLRPSGPTGGKAKAPSPAPMPVPMKMAVHMSMMTRDFMP